MSKDKFSDDHEIAVIGGTNTVVISDNLSVTDNVLSPKITTSRIDAEDTAVAIRLHDSLSIVEDLTVGQNLIVENHVTVGDNISVEGNLVMGSSVGDPSTIIMQHGSGGIRNNMSSAVELNVYTFHTTVNVETGAYDQIYLSSLFDTDTNVYLIDGLIADLTGSVWYSQGFNSVAQDFRWSIRWHDPSSSITLSFIGADWPAIAEARTVRLSMWYHHN